MDQQLESKGAKDVASEIDAEIRALPVQNTPSVRAIRRRYSRKLKQARPEFILAVAGELLETYGHRGVPYELIRHHRAAFRSVGEAELQELGRGINSWWSVDSFARTLAGPAWLEGQVTDELIHRWAHSEDLWWRRAALVSTVALNVAVSLRGRDTYRRLSFNGDRARVRQWAADATLSLVRLWVLEQGHGEGNSGGA
jgi:3-methyladenine DNA glycosylase AlkD